MTNTLRSRIAAALQYADRRMALEDEMPVGAYYASLADAVIRELKLLDLVKKLEAEIAELEQRDTTTKSGSTENRHRL